MDGENQEGAKKVKRKGELGGERGGRGVRKGREAEAGRHTNKITDRLWKGVGISLVGVSEGAVQFVSFEMV